MLGLKEYEFIDPVGFGYVRANALGGSLESCECRCMFGVSGISWATGIYFITGCEFRLVLCLSDD